MLKKVSILALICLSLFNLTTIITNQIVYASDTQKTLNKDITFNESGDENLTVSFSVDFKTFLPVLTDDYRTVYLPQITNAELSDLNPGEPFLCLKYENIYVPSPDGFQIVEIDPVNVKSFSMVPAPVGKKYFQNRNEQISYHINNTLYSNYKTPAWADLKYAGIARDHYIARLSFTAARFNPSTNSIEIPEKINVKIKFNNNNISKQNFSNLSNFNFPIALNSNQSVNWIVNPKQTINTNEIYNLKKDRLAGTVQDNWVKIAVDAEGIYRIDHSMLSSLGISLSPADLATIKIYGNGGVELSEKVSDGLKNQMNEQPIIVRTNSGGGLESILFYGAPANGFSYNGTEFRHYLNHYSYSNYYLMTWGGTSGLRANPVEQPPGVADNTPMSYTAMIFNEEEKNNPYAAGSGRTWFGPTTFNAPYINLLNDLDRNSVVTYRFALAHKAEGNCDGIFDVFENNTKLTSDVLSGINSGNYEAAYRDIKKCTIPASMISMDNRSILKFNYSNANCGLSAIPYIDFFEIYYQRPLLAVDNEISIFTDPSLKGVTEYDVNGFNGNDLLCFDVTSAAHPLFISNNSKTGGMFIFKTELSLNSPKKFYITSNFKQPKLEKTSIGGYRSDIANCEVIVISHPDLIKSAEAYKAYRESASELKVFVARTDYIYNEFGSGVPDITAIRDFLAYCFANWQVKPKYVLLWGDGHIDYKNIQTNVVNFVPPYESLDDIVGTYNETNSYVTDDYYARVAGDDYYIDMGIGRITVTSNDEGMFIVDRIRQYENSSSNDSWRSIGTYIADDGRTSGNNTDCDLHTTQSENLTTNPLYTETDLQQKKLYLIDYPTENLPNARRKPGVTEDLISTVNTTGTLLLDFIGHANVQVWTHESIFDKETTPQQFRNLDKLFFVNVAACDFGRYDRTDTRCGSEILLYGKNGGAIGVFSAARVVMSGDNARINDAFHTYLYQRDTLNGKYLRLGDVIYSTKQASGTTINDWQFYLLGDPAMRLNIPDYYVNIDSINGIPYNSSNPVDIKLKALSKVNINCSIIKPNGTEFDPTFNGTSIVTMCDGDDHKFIKDEDGCTYNFQKQGGALNKSSYKVTNGKFTASFIIPKDISFSKNNGRFFAYAYSDNNNFAKGFATSFTIEGIDTSVPTDGKGPVITLFLDDRSFKSGDIVRQNPLLIVDLFDNEGINTTGLGIGHKIEAWIDDNPNSIDLTSSFVSSPEDSRYGSAQQYLFGINPGYHKIKVRAWDVYNNFSVAETYFIIPDNSGGVNITNLMNYPNPFDTKTIFSFNHDLTPPFNASIDIYNVTGVHVKKLSQIVNTLHKSEIEWDGRDENGAKIASGVYVYYLTVNSDNGLYSVCKGILSMITK